MTAKEYLKQIKSIDRKIAIKKDEITSMRIAVYGGSGSCGNVSVKKSHDNGTEKAILRVMEYEEQKNAEIDRLVAAKEEIIKAIDDIPDIAQHEVLIQKYVNYQEWDEIAEKMGYSKSYIFQLHKTALKKIVVNRSKS